MHGVSLLGVSSVTFCMSHECTVPLLYLPFHIAWNMFLKSIFLCPRLMMDVFVCGNNMENS